MYRNETVAEKRDYLVLGLIIAEKVQRDAEYEEIYNHFTELYIKGRGIV